MELEVVVFVVHIVKGAFVEGTGSKQIVVDTTTGNSTAAVSKPCIQGSPRSYLVAIAVVVVVDNFAHIAERIGATVGCKNCTGCSFGHMCPTLAGYWRKYSRMPSDLG